LMFQKDLIQYKGENNGTTILRETT
jgi:hypothetical protein